MADEHLGLDDGTEGANVGYRSYQGPAEERDDDKDPADVDFEEDEDVLDEEDDEGGQEDEDDNKNEDVELDDPDLSPKAKQAIATAQKRMERQYEKRLAAFAPQRELLELAGALQEDPKGTITSLARKYGVRLVEDAKGDDGDVEDLAPPGKEESLDSYIKRAVAHGVKAALKEKGGEKKVDASPAAIDEDLATRRARAGIAQRVAYLNAMYDDWKELTEEMGQVLKKEPELRDNLDKLYKRAKELKKSGGERKKEKVKREGGKSRKFSTGERGTGQVQTRKPKGKMSFNDAWEAAKRDLSRRK